MKADFRKFALIGGVALVAVAIASRVEPARQLVFNQ